MTAMTLPPRSLTPFVLLLIGLLLRSASPVAAQVVETAQGRLEGTTDSTGLAVFKGVPYARPPVRGLRWKPPQPPESWTSMRRADRFGPRCMQRVAYADMLFRSEGMSEDCLYLNVWTPAVQPERDTALADSSGLRPVLVYFYGGGFTSGDGSEPRYDGASMARKDLVVVTLNYRLGVFGFMAHPELSAESAANASGNYGLLDQYQALRWVRENIEAFGGDPDRVTIAGESAGSLSVSAHMASPLSAGLFDGAIGESGAVLGTLPPVTLDEAEAAGARFANRVGGTASLADLRALSAAELLNQATKPGVPRFNLAVDGYFLPRPPAAVYTSGEQATVPLLVGWNSQEMGHQAVLRGEAPTPENFQAAVRDLYGDRAEEALEVYPAPTRAEVLQAATDLASNRFIGYGTWKWAETQRQTGAPVYRYFYVHPRPPMKDGVGNTEAMTSGGNGASGPPPRGAVHSAEIEYALGNLRTNDIYEWAPEDYRVSEAMQAYFANFVKTGNPNGPNLPQWPQAGEEGAMMVLRLGVTQEATPEPNRVRYLFHDRQAEGE